MTIEELDKLQAGVRLVADIEVSSRASSLALVEIAKQLVIANATGARMLGVAERALAPMRGTL